MRMEISNMIIFPLKTDLDLYTIILHNHTSLILLVKVLFSYILGHAICEGKIAGINTKVNDWPLIKDTLYHNQSLLNLINMAANDNNYVDDTKGMKSSGRWYNIHSIKSFAERELKGSKQSSNFNRKYNYNGLLTNIIMNYIVHKTDYEFEALLNRVFKKKLK